MIQNRSFIVAFPTPVGTSDNVNFNTGDLPVVPAEAASNRYVRFVWFRYTVPPISTVLVLSVVVVITVFVISVPAVAVRWVVVCPRDHVIRNLECYPPSVVSSVMFTVKVSIFFIPQCVFRTDRN